MEKTIEITEDYVSFETAKLLKEKGFDKPVCQYYNHKKNLRLMASCLNWNKTELFHSSPTLQMAIKWLREEHRIFLNVSYIPEHFAFTYRVISPLGETKFVTYVDTYEEAYEAAIKYCLENLI